MNEILNETFLNFSRYDNQFPIVDILPRPVPTASSRKRSSTKSRKARSNKTSDECNYSMCSIPLESSNQLLWTHQLSEQSAESMTRGVIGEHNESTNKFNISPTLIQMVRDFLNHEGRAFFKELLKQYGLIDVVLNKQGRPHKVIDHEGKQIMDFIWLKCKHLIPGWTCEDILNNWVEITKKAIK